VFGASFAAGSGSANVLLNLSNLAWFNDSIALNQHLNIGRMRVMELGLPMIRATNTGISALINAQGQVTHQTAIQAAEVLYGTIQPYRGTTPYQRWRDTPIVVLCVLLCVLPIVLPMMWSALIAKNRA
jgi:apolipoprotein N-acyltransferase